MSTTDRGILPKLSALEASFTALKERIDRSEDETTKKLEKIDEKLDKVLSQKSDQLDHYEQRITSLEHSRTYAIAAGVGIAALCGFLGFIIQSVAKIFIK